MSASKISGQVRAVCNCATNGGRWIRRKIGEDVHGCRSIGCDGHSDVDLHITRQKLTERCRKIATPRDDLPCRTISIDREGAEDFSGCLRVFCERMTDVEVASRYCEMCERGDDLRVSKGREANSQITIRRERFEQRAIDATTTRHRHPRSNVGAFCEDGKHFVVCMRMIRNGEWDARIFVRREHLQLRPRHAK